MARLSPALDRLGVRVVSYADRGTTISVDASVLVRSMERINAALKELREALDDAPPDLRDMITIRAEFTL